MSKKLLAAVSLVFAGAASIGCVSPDLQRKIDDLTREQEELHREKAQTEAELLAYKARCESLERSRGVPQPVPAATPRAAAPSPEMPGDLEGKVDIRKRGNDTVIDIPSDVFFASGSATLSGASEKTMSQIAEYIRRHPGGGMLRVEGHSDADPIRRSKSKFHCNWELSFERAHAVMHYLVDKGGFDPHRVVCEAYGEFQPLDPRIKSKNRRVEIVIAQ
ncbi:MAG TPA: OmpA family protein [Planctomycetota bacterium]|nr:OmpA family protein [Planctomycetota bacterium]